MKEELLQRLDLLAAKLGVAVEHLWEILTRQGFVEGAYGLGLSFLGIVLLFPVYLLCRVATRMVMDDDTGFDDRGPGLFFICAAIAILALWFIFSGIGDSKFLFNPEYFALQEITNLMK